MKRSTVVILLVAVGCLATAGVALAAGAKTTVRIEFQGSPDGDKLSGQVKSEKASCVKGRKVKLGYRASETGDIDKIAAFRADKQGRFGGRWSEFTDSRFAQPGYYKALATPTDGCESDESNQIQVGS